MVRDFAIVRFGHSCQQLGNIDSESEQLRKQLNPKTYQTTKYESMADAEEKAKAEKIAAAKKRVGVQSHELTVFISSKALQLLTIWIAG